MSKEGGAGYSGAFTTKLLRSNPGSTLNVEIYRDDLKEGRRIFICLNACKKGWKVGCRPGWMFFEG